MKLPAYTANQVLYDAISVLYDVLPEDIGCTVVPLHVSALSVVLSQSILVDFAGLQLWASNTIWDAFLDF